MSRRIREALVALFVLGGVALAVFAYSWLSGRLGRGRTRPVTVYFSDVTGLRVGDPVEVLGIQKGRVANLVLERARVRATIALDREVVLPEDSRFAIRSVSYLGSDRYVMVVPGQGPAVHSGVKFEGTNEALNLEETFLRLDRLLSKIDPTQLTGELAKARDDLMAIVRTQLQTFNTSFAGATGDLNRLVARLDTLVQLVNKESTAGKLVSSTELYEEIRQTNVRIQELVSDIKLHPERYVKVRFSLFK